MMKNKHIAFVPYIFILIFAVILSACSSSEKEVAPQQGQVDSVQTEEAEQKEDNHESEDDLQAFLTSPTLPNDTKSFLQYPSGKFSMRNYDENQEVIEEELSQWPALAKENGEEEVKQYFGNVLALFAEDYPHPDKLVAEWKENDFGNPELEDPRLEFKENYNVEIILDASGSMAAEIGGTSMMQLAKESIEKFADSLPDEANVALRVYGYEGTGSDEDKQLSCESNKLFYEMEPYDSKKFSEALEQFQPSGWTPVAESLLKAKEDFAEYDGENNTNIIYLVSDGVETCDGDPVAAAKQLSESNITPLINVIGFNVDSEGQQQLKKVAEAANGTYATVRNMEQLQSEFDRSQEMASKWLNWKIGAESANIDQILARENSIFDYKYEWGDKSSLEIRNIDKALLYLYKTHKLSSEQYQLIKKERQARYDMANKTENRVYKDLLNMAKEDYKKMEKEINEKYKSAH
ncbi:Ca-activated chloride channel family protein [Lederbergia galactosidilyticus]|nr:Ca-activated chloride channel family protein [Lederbergia galactosidilytica]